VVGGIPASAADHYPQLWHGDRPDTRAWRRAGYELDRVDVGRTATFRRRESPSAPASPKVAPAKAPWPRKESARSALADLDPHRALIILPCSARKARGGSTERATGLSSWPEQLLDRREQLAPRAMRDEGHLMPAWRRYTGTFYETAHEALADATAVGADIVILSGGYGVVKADEPIGWYDIALRAVNWPGHAIESALLAYVERVRPASIVAFLSATTDYARIVRRTAWPAAGSIPVHLVTARADGGGAMVKVPRLLGQAFSAFWTGRLDKLPGSISVDRLA
jgi:hypothetical protein